MHCFFGLLVVCVTLAVPSLRPMAGETPVQASLEIQVIQPNIIAVIARCSTERTDQLRYLLVADKTGRSGNAKSRQAGQFTTKANAQVVLCNLKFSLAPDDQLHFSLKVFKGATIVAAVEKDFNAI